MNYIIFGGSGFIGTHLIKEIKNRDPQGQIYNLDIVMPGEESVVPGIVEKIDGVHYERVDSREKIEWTISTSEDDIVFNLAAVHRTPGHEDIEYFETNIKDAENVTEWCEKQNIKRIVFTSSIAPYGAAEELKKETTLPTPNTPYGISKLVAEKIHEMWQARTGGKLIIVRPGIVYGKGEHGNMTRLYKGIKGRYFFYAGRKDTIKACIYVKELVNFFFWALEQNEDVQLYNCTYEPAFNIEQEVEAIKAATGLKRTVMLVPSLLLMSAAYTLGPIGGKKLGIHPARVKKLMVSTNISGEKMKNSGYKLKYKFEDTYKDWFEDCNKKGLF